MLEQQCIQIKIQKNGPKNWAQEVGGGVAAINLEREK